jgi:nucleotide-binding universal stress UspA family protein
MPTVLAPIDGSDLALRAVPWAAALAGAGGTVVLLRVVPGEPTKANDAATAEANAELDAAAAAMADTGATVERLVMSGEPDAEIVAAAERRGADLIAMASHGRGALGRAIFGSVADRVSRSATVPVLILRTQTEEAGHTPAIRRIVVPLDGSPLAERALPAATALARQFRAPLHVVRAVDVATVMPVAPGVFGTAPVVNAEVATRVWEDAEAAAKATVSDAVKDLQRAGLEASGAMLNGSPYFAISDILQPGDLLVLTSHGRGGVRRWLLGSVAEKLVREAPAPVLLVPAAERDGRREAGGGE